MKTCKGPCKETKPLTEFHMKRGKPQAQCKECRSEYMAKRYVDNIEVEKAKRKANYEKNKSQILEERKVFYKLNAEEINLKRRLKKYGLTKEQFYEMLESQNYKCANKGCESGNESLAIDHCHFSLIVRGLLCDNCNTALGLLKESLAALNGLRDYLLKYKK